MDRHAGGVDGAYGEAGHVRRCFDVLGRHRGGLHVVRGPAGLVDGADRHVVGGAPGQPGHGVAGCPRGYAGDRGQCLYVGEGTRFDEDLVAKNVVAVGKLVVAGPVHHHLRPRAAAVQVDGHGTRHRVIVVQHDIGGRTGVSSAIAGAKGKRVLPRGERDRMAPGDRIEAGGDLLIAQPQSGLCVLCPGHLLGADRGGAGHWIDQGRRRRCPVQHEMTGEGRGLVTVAVANHGLDHVGPLRQRRGRQEFERLGVRAPLSGNGQVGKPDCKH